MAFSGIIPTIRVSSNSSINSIAGGLVNNSIGGIVNVALSSSMGQQLSKALGLPPTSAPKNLLSSIITPGLLDLGNQAITGSIVNSITNSKALGPAGPLVASLASKLAGNVFDKLTGGILNSFSPESTGQPTKYFPGVGDEEDANYGGSAYTSGPVGPDVVFSIKPASSAANIESTSQVEGNGVGVPEASGVNEVVPEDSGDNPVPKSVQTNAYSSTMESYTQGSTASFPGLKTAFSFSPASSTTLSSQQIAEAYSGTFSDLAPSLSNVPDFDSAKPLSIGTEDFFNMASLVPEAWDDTYLSSDIDPLDYGFSSSTESGQSDGWKFTTAPGNVTWDTTAKVERVPIFGTNQPPVISGSKGMRELTLSDALIEGFSMGKAVEGKIAKLESLLDFTLTSSCVKVPVYWVAAQDKKYGASNDEGGYFVIKQIKVKEELRDLTGRSTRAMVDVSFTQVPSYQVDDGRDLASQSIAGGSSILGEVSKQVDQNYKAEVAKQKVLEAAKPGTGGKPAKPGTKGGTADKVSCKGVLYNRTVRENQVNKTLDTNTCQYSTP